MFIHIKRKILTFLKPSEALSHVRDDLNIDIFINLHRLLTQLRKEIDALQAPPEHEEDEKAFHKTLEEMAELIQATRHKAAALLEQHPSQKKFDLYLNALQLHLQNYDYYLSIGIDFFTDQSKTGFPSELFYNMGLPWCGTQLSDYLGLFYYDVVMQPEYPNDETIDKISEFFIVYVTAASPNPYGHVILGTDQGYFHANGLSDRPQYFPKEQMNEYLRKTFHLILGVQQVYVPHPEESRKALKTLKDEIWHWRPKHNCVNFAHTVLTAGGVSHAHVDPIHIGDYNHHIQYPVELLGYANPISLNKKAYDTLPKEKKAALKHHHEDDIPVKKHFIHLGKCAGLQKKEAKTYAKHRMDDGMRHKEAQYKTKPSFMNFLVLHHHKIECVAVLNPLLFILATPFLVLAHLKLATYHVNSFFYKGKKNQENKHTMEAKAKFHEEGPTAPLLLT